MYYLKCICVQNKIKLNICSFIDIQSKINICNLNVITVIFIIS